MSGKRCEKWEAKMNAARLLRKQGAGLLFDRVSLLVECYNDPAFRAWCVENDTPELDYLDAEVSDTACEFLTLLAVLKEYPERAAWEKHNIRDMIATVLDAQRRDREKEEAHRQSWKERCLAAEKENERLRGELNTLSARVSELQGALAIVSTGKRPILQMDGGQGDRSQSGSAGQVA